MKKLFYSWLISVSFYSAHAQQYVIAEKNNTHPDIQNQESAPAFITSLKAERGTGYNDISWSAAREDDIRKYIIEYSVDAINFQSAGELLSAKGAYSFRHQITDFRPALYRVKIEQLNGRYSYSSIILLDGNDISPFKVYPTVIQGNTININAYWPIEKITVTASNGVSVLTKILNGQRDYISIVLPSLSKGLYWITAYGNNWRSTNKFIVP
jgi:hypothetical protein